MGCGASRVPAFNAAWPAPGPVPLAAETAEQRAAELAELRRLTPEQEAAAAAAAQRIGEVAAAAEAAPEDRVGGQVLHRLSAHGPHAARLTHGERYGS